MGSVGGVCVSHGMGRRQAKKGRERARVCVYMT